MNVTEAHRARHLLIHLDRSDDVSSALLSALGAHEARAAFITGEGSLELAEIAAFDAGGREIRRRIDSPSTVISLQGSAAMNAGTLGVSLTVTLARETELGLSLAGGTLVAGLARSLDLWVTVLDDLRLERAAGEHGPALAARKHGSVLEATSASPAPKASAPPVIPPARGSEPQGTMPAFQAGTATAPPQKPFRPKEDLEVVYPEEGDVVNHFAFGELTVVGSDGDNLTVRAEPDGRVRTIALKVLRVEGQPDGPDGRRRFKLVRKN